MFQLPKEIAEDIEKYKRSHKDFKTGQIAPARFKGIRVPWGIYSHRGGKVFMTRIRIPAGLVTSSQLKALAETSKQFGNEFLHITTRQDIQIHQVKLDDVPSVMDLLKDHQLSSRGGGGNTVRNIVACDRAGICLDEIFDVRETAVGLTEYLLSQETSFNLPRKFKIAFSGCTQDCAGCLVNDVGFSARILNDKKGFAVFVGGGMGAQPRIGKKLINFLSIDEVGYCVAAIKNIFYTKGDRRNKHRNRLRFLIEDMGIESFKQLYEDEFTVLKQKEKILLRSMHFRHYDERSGKIPVKTDPYYNTFVQYNVKPQKQKGWVYGELRIPRGDIAVDALIKLADLDKEFPGIEFRTSQNQNLIVCGILVEDVYKLYIKLTRILKDFYYPRTLLDVVACKGSATCNLGLCNSPALAQEIEHMVKESFINSTISQKLEIKINGCPNACGQHPVGKIALYGMVRRVNGHPVPLYKVLVGGRKEGELSQFAEETCVIPAKQVPVFLKRLLQKAEEINDEKQHIYENLLPALKGYAKEISKDFQHIPDYTDNQELYIDWGRNEKFSLAGLGTGECGAGIIDMIESDLTEARIALEESNKGKFDLSYIQKALFLSARALLVVKGRDPHQPKEVFADFTETFIASGIASDEYASAGDRYDTITQGLIKNQEETVRFAKQFYEHIQTLYKSMDPSFNFPRQREVTRTVQPESRVLNLKGTPCPINYVKTKLFLENLNSGDILEVILDEGEPIKSVPKSLEQDGHRILKIEKENEWYRVKVEKK